MGSVARVPSTRPRWPAAAGTRAAEDWSETAAVATWDGRYVHVWGWDGRHTSSTNWLYRGFRAAPWPGSPLGHGQLGSIDVGLTSVERVRPVTARLDPVRGADWLLGIDEGGPIEDSMAWLAAVARLAVSLVDAGRVMPRVAGERDGFVAQWRPVVDDTVERAVQELAVAVPPLVLATDPDPNPADATPRVLAALVDGIARGRLLDAGWSVPAVAGPKPSAGAIRALFAALARPESVIRTVGVSTADALTTIAGRLDRLARRAEGEPVVVPRLRLVVPDDPYDEWEVVLELVDEADPGRWCRADDVWDRTPLALEVAGHERYLASLEASIVETAITVGKAIEPLRDLADAHEPSAVELDIEQAEAFLEQAPAELDARGIDLIGPERLLRAGIGVHGRATPAESGGGPARFSREAVVQWSVTAIDDDGPSAITDAELARAVAAGSTLLHTGRKWVRIDPAALRRVRKRVDEHLRDHTQVDALTLIRLAAAGDADIAVADDLNGAELDTNVDGWAGDVLSGLPDEALEETVEPIGFVGALRPYQRRGLSWLRFLARLGLGGCLADDMGLGKTATTLAHLLDRPGPHLVICPLSVVHNWEAESRRFAPSLRVLVHHGADRVRDIDDRQHRLDGLVDDAPADLTITTYGLLARDVAHLAQKEWSTVVLDEAQMIKNPGTHAARAVRQIPAVQKLALTGTPVENRLGELWAILDAVNPGMLGSRERFRHRFANPIERDGNPEKAAELRRLTQPFVLRRTKADRSLVPDLPDKIEQIAWAGLTKEQAALYQHVVDELLANAPDAAGMKRRGLVLAALTRLKQICNHPAHALGDRSRLAGRSGKLTRFDELVDNLLDVGERALVFTQFVEMGELLQRHLTERLGIRAPFLHGGVSKARRDSMVADFQAGLGAPLLLVSLKAGGTGLNLTAASQVIHYDRWWNPAVEDQATDRAWRLGQGRTVNVHKLVCEGTVEERINTLIDDKRALADTVIGTGETWLSELSTDDLRALVQLDTSATS